MDEKDKKIKELTDALAAEKAGRATDKTAFEATIAEKDSIITQKTNDVVGARKEYKKLSDMTEAEKAAMSEKEIELQKRQEELDARQEGIEKTQKETLQKEVDARKERAISRLAGKDPELAKKIKDSYAKIVDHDKAQTDEEVAAIATSAFNMLGIPKPDGVREAINAGGGEAGGAGGDQNFADTSEGKSLGNALNLKSTEPAPAGEAK